MSTNTIKRSLGDSIVQAIIYIICGVAGIVTLVPFLYIIAGSFATERELTERSFFLIPKVFSLNAYQYIIKSGDVFKGLRNSFFVATVGVAINMFCSCTLAYPISRPYFKGRNGFITMVIITMLFSGGMVPMYILVANVLGLRNTFWALWLPVAINPFNMIIIKNYFQGLPMELEEASRIDGCNDLQIFIRVILPLSKPVLASVSLFYAVSHWNSYFNAMMYISNRDMEVVQIVLRRIIFQSTAVATESNFDWGNFGLPPTKSIRMATTIMASLPILVLYPFIQKYFTKGVLIGSVKG